MGKTGTNLSSSSPVSGLSAAQLGLHHPVAAAVASGGDPYLTPTHVYHHATGVTAAAAAYDPSGLDVAYQQAMGVNTAALGQPSHYLTGRPGEPHHLANSVHDQYLPTSMPNSYRSDSLLIG